MRGVSWEGGLVRDYMWCASCRFVITIRLHAHMGSVARMGLVATAHTRRADTVPDSLLWTWGMLRGSHPHLIGVPPRDMNCHPIHVASLESN